MGDDHILPLSTSGKIQEFISLDGILNYLDSNKLQKKQLNDILTKLNLSEEGYLLCLDDWHPNVAVAMSAVEKQLLTKNHWLIIAFIRLKLKETGHALGVRELIREINSTSNKITININTKNIYTLFPYSLKQAYRYAGLPAPMAGN